MPAALPGAAAVGHMQSCSECGSSDLETRVEDGVAVLECGLCGALAGEVGAVQAVLDARQARRFGVDPALWPLQRLIGSLPGLVVAPDSGRVQSRAGAAALEVRFLALDARGLAQLENVAKSLELQRSGLALDWRIEVGYRETLTFTLRPAPPPAGAPRPELHEVRTDLATLTRALERNRGLSWWRHP